MFPSGRIGVNFTASCWLWALGRSFRVARLAASALNRSELSYDSVWTGSAEELPIL